MKQFNNLVFVLNGPSASGKTTILEALTKGIELPDGSHIPPLENMEPLITVTTRPPRPGEIEGVHYNFLTPEQFEEEKAKGNIVEETVYAGVKYGILDTAIQAIRNAGKDAVVVLDMHGISEMKRFYGAENVVSIFVYRELDDILAELRKRPITEEEVMRRYEQAKSEIAANFSRTDYRVLNTSTVKDLVAQVANIVREERAKHNRTVEVKAV